MMINDVTQRELFFYSESIINTKVSYEIVSVNFNFNFGIVKRFHSKYSSSL